MIGDTTATARPVQGSHHRTRSGGYVSDEQLAFELLPHLAQGLENREIGERLHLSVDAVVSRTKCLYRVLGARNRTHAVALAYARGLLAVPSRPSTDSLATSLATPFDTPPRAVLHYRNRLAQSILAHRAPSPATVHAARRALAGECDDQFTPSREAG